MAHARAVCRRGRLRARQGTCLDAVAGVAYRRSDAARCPPERPGVRVGPGSPTWLAGVPEHIHAHGASRRPPTCRGERPHAGGGPCPRVSRGRPPTATVDTAWRVARPRTLARPGRGGDADDSSVAPLSPVADSRSHAAVRASQRPGGEPG